MKIEKIKVLRGPNIWSISRPQLIDMVLQIGALEEQPTDKIEGFGTRLRALLPSLYEHRCSEGREGGFFERVARGTWMGHVVEHVAIEMQILAGHKSGFGRTRGSGKHGEYHVVFDYEFADAGTYAARAAVHLCEALIVGIDYEKQLQEDLDYLRNIHRRQALGPSTSSIIEEARKRNIPVTRLNEESLFMLGWGKNQKLIRAGMSSETSSIGVDIACDKARTKKVLRNAHIPVPKGVTITKPESLEEAIAEVGFPLVIKPVDGNHGRGITTNIRDTETAVAAFERAQAISSAVIIEQFVCGWDYRFILVNKKLVAVAKRTPAAVEGDGMSTIEQLIEKVNADPRRGDGHEKVLTKIVPDAVTQKLLDAQHYTMQTVLRPGEIFFLKDTANISTGGTAIDLTHLVHPENVFMAERIARLIDLDICGIDIVAQDINVPITGENGAVIEVNAAPGFRMHLTPAKGLPRNLGERVVDMLFPNESDGRIPVVAVTGTNGKTTTTRLISAIAKAAGKTPGFTTTDGIYLDNHLIYKGDCSGPSSAETVLRDSIIDFAVLECARGGILRSGLGFDACDVSVVTNISEDHIGVDGISGMRDLKRIKQVVPSAVKKDCYAVLNADDDYVYAMRRDLDCKIALFSCKAENERIAKHCAQGGLAVFVEDGHFVVADGKWKTRLAEVASLPITFRGTASSMIQNLLAAITAALAVGFEKNVIADALRGFLPTPENTPGRMNLFPFRFADVMVDYAHNEAGFLELQNFMAQHPAPYKIGVVAGTGDRRDDDIRKIGFYAARMFNEVIVRDDQNMRGRGSEEIFALIADGVLSADTNVPIRHIPDEQEAITHALACAPAGTLILVCADKVHETLEMVRQMQKSEMFPQTEGKSLKQAS